MVISGGVNNEIIACECNMCKQLIKKESIKKDKDDFYCNDCFKKRSKYKYERKVLENKLGTMFDILSKYKCYIAGGTITSIFTNKEIRDIDIYFKSKKELIDFMSKGEYFLLSATDKAFTFKIGDLEYQAIFFDYFNSAEDIFERFDFTVCMGAYDFEKQDFVLHEDFLKHNASKIIKFNPRTDYPIISALRIDKYKQKGYEISKSEFIKIMVAINNLKIKTFKDFKNHCGGMYGENYDKVFDELQDEDFDMEKAFEKIEEIDNISESSKVVDFGACSYLEFIHKITDEKVCSVFTYDNRFINKDLEEIFVSEDSEHLYNIVDVKELLNFPLRFYKYVRKEDGRYISFYDYDFKYVLGEEIVPKNTGRVSSGIYCSKTKEDLVSSTYHSKDEKVIIELEIDSLDDIKVFKGYNGIVLNKCKVIGECS